MPINNRDDGHHLVDSPSKQGIGLMMERYRRLALLLPVAAGLAVGILIVEALTFPEIAGQFWPPVREEVREGAPAIQGPAAATRALIIAAAVCSALVLWLVLTLLLRKERALREALTIWTLPFAPFASILVLYAIDVVAVPGIMVFANHLVVLSSAAFMAIGAAIIVLRRGETALQEAPGKGRNALWWVAGFAVVYWLTFSALGILQYYSLKISYTDTADWEQMLWNMLHGRFLRTTAFEHMFLGEHVQFVHFLLLPFYALFPSLATMMVLKSAALASAAFPVYLLARDRLGSKASGAAFAAAYLLYPAMQYVDLELTYNTFRPVALAIPAFLWALYFLEKRRMLPLCIASAFALMSKEEMALPLAMIGLVLLFDGKRGWGAAVFAVSVAWFLTSVLWVIPHFRVGESHMWRYYEDFGKDLNFARLVWRIVSNPIHTLAVIVRPVKIGYLLLLLVPLGLRPLFSRRILFLMLPSLATTLLASREPSFTIYYHYQAALVPFMVTGAVYGAAFCVPLVSRVAGLFTQAAEGVRRRAAVAALTVLVLASAVFGNVLFAQSPISLLFYNRGMQTHWRNRYVPTERSRVFFSEIRPLVPADATVSATEFLATYFAAREVDYVFPLGVGEVEYLVVDSDDPWLKDRLEKKDPAVLEALEHTGYDVVFEKTGFAVYRKSDAGGRT